MGTPGTPRRRYEQLRRVRDPRRRVVEATALLEQLGAEVARVSAARDAAVQELYLAGSTFQEIADVAGLTRGRIAQILRRARQRQD